MNHTFKIDKINNKFYSYEYCYMDGGKVKALNILDKNGDFKKPNIININSDLSCLIKLNINDFMVYTEYDNLDGNEDVKFIIKKVDNINNYKYELRNIYNGCMSISVYNNIKSGGNVLILKKILQDYKITNNIIKSLSLIGVKVFYERYDVGLNYVG